MRYCRAIRCEGTTVEGCHSSSDFFEPSCEDCSAVFPRACKRHGRDSSDRDSSDSDSRTRDSSDRDSSDGDSSDTGRRISYKAKNVRWRYGPKALRPRPFAPATSPVPEPGPVQDPETFYGVDTWQQAGGVSFRVVASP